MDKIKFTIKKEREQKKLRKNSFRISTPSTGFYCTRNNSLYYRIDVWVHAVNGRVVVFM